MESSEVPSQTDGQSDTTLIKNGRFSSAFKSVLEEARFEQATGGVTKSQTTASSTAQPAWSLASVITAAASPSRISSGGASSIFANNAAFTRTIRQNSQWPGGAFPALSTNQVASAIRDAMEIRSRTGGKDDFLGLRHVLFSILVPEDPEAYRTLFQMIADGGSDPMEMASAITIFCQKDLEKGENKDVWKEIATQRLPGVLALDIRPERPQEVAAARSDDPWASHAVDRSGASLEAEAFASMITWRDFTPPIAVGVFGDWGSGKSFFMRLVYDAIERRCAANRKSEKDNKILDHVVQIRFNAWHYAETNLWASLVDHLLTELDAWAQRHQQGDASRTLFNRLDTAREQTLEAARDLTERRRAQHAAQASLQAAEAALKTKREELLEDPQTWITSAWEETWDSAVQPELGKAARELGLTDALPKTAEEMRQAAALYDPSQGFRATRDWIHFVGQHPIWAGIALLLILVLPAGLAAALSSWDLSPVGGIVGGVLAPLIAGMAMISRGLRRAHAKLSEVHLKVQGKIAAKSAEHEKSQAAAKAALVQAEAELTSASQRLHDTEAALEAVKQEYDTQEGKGRVLKFIRDRITAGDYRKQLSFVAEVRRDFDQLSLLMNKSTAPYGSEERLAQHRRQVEAFIASKEAEGLLIGDESDRLRGTYAPDQNAEQPPVFERIVLYIDDLDRCPAEQVVVVLQAIHLLLAYPLFVVFVAVDVRWLRAALEKEYPQFAPNLATNGSYRARAESLPEPSDYLEKIFQLPYWVRTMSEDNAKDLLADLMASQSAEAEPQDEAQASGPEAQSLEPEASTGRERGEHEEPEGRSAASEPKPVRLELTEAEQTYVTSLAAGLDGSPRRALRFINSYRLIKASLPASRRLSIAQGGYRAILTVLAIQVGQFDEIDGQDCCTALMAQIEIDPATVLNWVKEIPESDTRRRFLHILQTFDATDSHWSELRDTHELVARFSFEMGTK